MRHDLFGSARLLIRPAIRWARPVPATTTTNPNRRRVGSTANETFGSVVITGTDHGSDHCWDRGTQADAGLRVVRPGSQTTSAANNPEVFSHR